MRLLRRSFSSRALVRASLLAGASTGLLTGLFGCASSTDGAPSDGARASTAQALTENEDWTSPATFTQRCEASTTWGTPLYFTYGQLKSQLGTNDCSELATRMAAATKLALNSGAYGASDIRPLALARHLVELTLPQQGVSDIAPLAGLTELQSLELPGNYVRDIAPLAALTGLRKLDIGDNPITSIEPLAALTELRTLRLKNLFVVRDLGFLASFPQLTSLAIDGNALVTLDGIERAPLLETVSLANNHVADLAPLDGLAHLAHAEVGGNAIASLAPLARLPEARGPGWWYSSNPITVCPTGAAVPNRSLASFCADFAAHPEWYGTTVTPPATTFATTHTVFVDAPGTSCLGVVVSPDLVLTSTACARVRSAGTAPHGIVRFPQTDGRPMSERRYAVESGVYADPERDAPSFDIAWVRFVGGLPAGVTPATIQRRTAPLSSGEAVWFTAAAGAQIAVERTQVREYRDDSAFFSVFTVGPAPLVHTSLCDNGTGGPAFIEEDGAWKLVGIFSGTDVMLNPASYASPSSLCVSGDLTFTHVPDYVPWLETSTGESLGGAARQAHVADPLDPATEATFTTFEQWCNDAAPRSEAAHTARYLRRWAAMQHARETFGSPEVIYRDCALASEALSRFLAAGQEPLSIRSTRYTHLGITDLAPLGTLHGMRELVLAFEALPDLGPLKSVAELRRLTLTITQAQPGGIVGLAGLDQVTSLDLYLDSVPEGLVEAIAGMSALEELTISIDHPTPLSLTALAALPSLRRIDLRGARSTPLAIDAASLRDLASLQSLSLQDVASPALLETVSLLPRLTELRVTRASFDPRVLPALRNVRTLTLSEIGPLSGAFYGQLNQMTWLESLDLGGYGGSVYAARFDGMTSLKTLRLHQLDAYSGGSSPLLTFGQDSPITSLEIDRMAQGTFDFALLAPLSRLETLTFRNGLTRSFDVIARLPALRHLSLESFYQPADVTFGTILSLTSLESLKLEDRSITALPSLAPLTSLVDLDLSRLALTSTDGIANLPRLERLHLENCQLSQEGSLVGLHDLPALRQLDLHGQSFWGLESIAALPDLPALEVLDVRANKIRNLDALRRLPNLRVAALDARWLDQMATCPVSDNVCVYADEVPATWNPTVAR
jgi:Leucine-rich repeat (LRR) protein